MDETMPPKPPPWPGSVGSVDEDDGADAVLVCDEDDCCGFCGSLLLPPPLYNVQNDKIVSKRSAPIKIDPNPLKTVYRY